MAGKKLEYIETIKAIVILLVCYNHIFYKLIPPPNLTNINPLGIILTFHMPIFFLISGLFAVPENLEWNTIKCKIKDKIRFQLYPTLLLGALFCYFFLDSDFNKMLFNNYKFGYWFVIVLIECFVISLPIYYYLRKRDVTRKTICIMLMVIGLLFKFLGFMLLAKGMEKISLISAFSILLLMNNFIYFAFGIVFRLYITEVKKYIISKYSSIVAIICYIYTLIDPFHFESIFPGSHVILNIFRALFACIICFNLFKLLQNWKWFKNSVVSKLLKFIGGSTLEIYLLHFFLVEIIGNNEFLMQSLLPVTGTCYEFPVLFVISGLIAMCCLAIVKILDILKIKWIVFPKKKKTTIKLVTD